MRKEKIQRKKSVRAVSGNESTDSGDSIQTEELLPSKNHTIMTVQDPDSYQPRLFTTMKIKGGETSKFQIDTGATCNVIRKKELKGTKYEKRIKPAAHVLKMYNKSSLSPVGKCKIQVQDVTTKKKFKVPFTVVDDHHVKNNLLGCRAVQQMKLIRVFTTNHIHQVNNDHMGLTMAEIEETYHDLFEGPATLTQIGTKIWKKGKVLRKVGIRSYEVQCNGNIYTRNRKFLKRSTAESESEDDADNDEPSDKSETEDVAVPPDNAASDAQESSGNEDVEASHQNRTRRGRVVRKPNRFGYSCK